MRTLCPALKDACRLESGVGGRKSSRSCVLDRPSTISSNHLRHDYKDLSDREVGFFMAFSRAARDVLIATQSFLGSGHGWAGPVFQDRPPLQEEQGPQSAQASGLRKLLSDGVKRFALPLEIACPGSVHSGEELRPVRGDGLFKLTNSFSKCFNYSDRDSNRFSHRFTSIRSIYVISPFNSTAARQRDDDRP